jgi:hypothetical protein
VAQAGHTVALYGRSPASLERGFATMDDMLGLLTEGDVISVREAEQARAQSQAEIALSKLVEVTHVCGPQHKRIGQQRFWADPVPCGPASLETLPPSSYATESVRWRTLVQRG